MKPTGQRPLLAEIFSLSLPLTQVTFFDAVAAGFFTADVEDEPADGVGDAEGDGVADAWESFTLIVGLEKVKPAALSLISPSASLTDSVEIMFVPPSLSMESVAEIGALLKP